MNFFKGNRKKIKGGKPDLKLNSQDERRIKLRFSMPLSERDRASMPKEVKAAFDAVFNVDNGIPHSVSELIVAPQTLEIYATEKSVRRSLLIVAAELGELTVSRPEVSSSNDHPEDSVVLDFSANVKWAEDVWMFAGIHFGKMFYVDFEEAQGVLNTEADAPGPAPTQLTLKKGGRSGKDAAAGKDED